jgi:hypothetical protein
MYLLYADESGTVQDASQQYFVLAGFCVFERQCYWLGEELEKIAARFDAADTASVELHGSPMLSGKKKWRHYPKEQREQAIQDALRLINSHPSNRVFASVIRKAAVSPNDPVEVAFEQLASRFDYYLRRLHKSDNSQRGLMIFDKSTYETTLQALATGFRTEGHTWDKIRNFAEVPLFLDSKASRLIQLADLIAFALFRYYESGDERFYSIIKPHFDAAGGIIHGLHESQ